MYFGYDLKRIGNLEVKSIKMTLQLADIDQVSVW